MTRNWLPLFGAAVLLLLPTSAAADNSACWGCGPGAKCDVPREPSFARKECEARRVCTNGQCFNFCATGTEKCASEDPKDGDSRRWPPWDRPQYLVLGSSPEAMEEISTVFDSSLVGALASQSLTSRHVGPSDGAVAFGGKTWFFSSTVEIKEKGYVTVTYQIRDHPAYSRVTIESPSRGVDLFVTAEKNDRSQRFESFSFEP